jgi:hypothetical protein
MEEALIFFRKSTMKSWSLSSMGGSITLMFWDVCGMERMAAPESNEDGQNNHRTIKSRSGHVFRLNDASGNETIEIIDKSGKNRIIVNTAENSITIEAEADITIKSATGKLTLQAARGIEMKSQAGISAQAAQSIDLKANAQVTVKGATIHLN